MTVSGGTEWIQHSINEGSLVAVTDGLYIRELYPNLCSAAFVLECSKGRGRIVGSFSECTDVANAYRGELLGLMVIHLILLSMNKINPTMKGRVEIISDCLGALNRVLYLPRTESLCDVDTPISSRTSSCTAGTSASPCTTRILRHTRTTTLPSGISTGRHAAKFRIATDGQDRPAPEA
jgi:hypothetical protein